MNIRKYILLAPSVLIGFVLTSISNASDFEPPAVSEFLMAQDREIALARSAAPGEAGVDRGGGLAGDQDRPSAQ